MAALHGPEPPAPWVMPLPAAPLADPKVAQLKVVFPDLDADILEAVLQHHAGNLEAAVAALIDVEAPGQEEAPAADEEVMRERDEQVARQLQMEIDDQVARAVAVELQQEVIEQERQQRQQEIGPRAVAAASTAAASTRKFFQMATQRARASLSKKDHGVRLLDGSEASSDAFVTPLASPLTSPLAEAYVAPVLPATPLSSISADLSPSQQYSSRVDRARLANRQSSRAASLSVTPTSSTRLATEAAVPQAIPTPPPAPLVPEGELI